eukprot:6183831-Pleurochrysis_carterae.AAC.1
MCRQAECGEWRAAAGGSLVLQMCADSSTENALKSQTRQEKPGSRSTCIVRHVQCGTGPSLAWHQEQAWPESWVENRCPGRQENAKKKAAFGTGTVLGERRAERTGRRLTAPRGETGWREAEASALAKLHVRRRESRVRWRESAR